MPYDFFFFDDEDSDDELVLNIFMQTRKRKRVRNRPDLLNEYDEDEFLDRFRLSKAAVLHLLALLNHLIAHKTERNDAVTPINQLLLTLRFFACADMLIALGDFGGIHKSTASRIVGKVTRAIASLGSTFIQLPRGTEAIKKAQSDFYRVAKFPRVIGAIDCTHVRIRSPGGPNAELFRGRHDYFSYNVQTVSNARLQITDIVASWPGATHDQTIYNSSTLKARMEMGQLENGVLIGDAGYALSNQLLTMIGNPTTPAESLYNESLIRTRNRVERSYGVWKRRFPILSLGIRLESSKVEAIIVACAVLHNIAIEMQVPLPPVSGDIERIIARDLSDDADERDRQIVTSGRHGIRDIFVRYFDRLSGHH